MDIIGYLIQLTSTICSGVALIIAYKALTINSAAQRNSLREKVWQWQFETIKEIVNKMTVFLESYGDYQANYKISKNVDMQGISKLSKQIEDFDLIIERMEFILPADIYLALLQLVNQFDKQIQNLKNGQQALTYEELYQGPIEFTLKLNSFFGIEEISHENRQLINQYKF